MFVTPKTNYHRHSVFAFYCLLKNFILYLTSIATQTQCYNAIIEKKPSAKWLRRSRQPAGLCTGLPESGIPGPVPVPDGLVRVHTQKSSGRVRSQLLYPRVYPTRYPSRVNRAYFYEFLDIFSLKIEELFKFLSTFTLIMIMIKLLILFRKKSPKWCKYYVELCWSLPCGPRIMASFMAV